MKYVLVFKFQSKKVHTFEIILAKYSLPNPAFGQAASTCDRILFMALNTELASDQSGVCSRWLFFFEVEDVGSKANPFV